MESSDDFAGLDVGGKLTAVWVIDAVGKTVWRGMVDTHPEVIDAALEPFKGMLSPHYATQAGGCSLTN
jgi:hypothetical protein